VTDPAAPRSAGQDALGPYDLLERVGKGGMGEVWKARDTRLDRTVAIKRLSVEHSARFRQEARAIAALNHPNICTLHDIGPDYLVMEYVEGAPAAGPVPVAEAIRLALEIAGALAEAHARGILHRDLKPANIMVTPRGSVKLLDFGLAKMLFGTDDVTRTAAGTIAGTVSYMSPEQARGEELDARSDMFSFGAVLYELLSGRRAFDGGSATDTLSAVLRDEPLALDVPRELERLVRRCLQKAREARYGSMDEVREALQQVVSPVAQADDETPSVAVLPFANMSADPENEYFCDGVAEEITSALSKVGRLRVAGRTSAFSFKGKTGDLREIGRALNVGTVLEGSVRKAGQRLRITAQLVKVADGYQLWSERYDRQMEDIFEIQDEIALAVVEALKVTLLGGEKAEVVRRSTDDPEAYKLCLKARHAWYRWTDEGFRTAMTLFRQALTVDPNYALAHFGLGDCHAAWALLGREPANLAGMRTSMETAIRLDPKLALAHAVLGAIVDGVYEYDWQTAEERCRTAVALNARSPHAINVYGILLGVQGRTEESLGMFRRAIELDPLNPTWNACFLQALLGSRDWERVFRQVDVMRELLPDHWYALQLTGQAQVATGRLDEATATLERVVRVSVESPYTIGLLSNTLSRAGRREEAAAQLARLRGDAGAHYVPSVALAFALAGLGQVDDAFAELNRALEVHDSWFTYTLTDFTILDDLRPDPRFADLRRRIGL